MLLIVTKFLNLSIKSVFLELKFLGLLAKDFALNFIL